MDESLYLFESIGKISDRAILETAEDLGIGLRRRARPRLRIWRTVLIAAAVAALMGATAYAAGLLGLTERVYPVEGTEQVVVVPNGLRGTATYEGSGEWWTWQHEHRNDEADGSLESLQMDDRMRSTCALYQVKTREGAEELIRIAEEKGLALYSDSVHALDRERLYALTGMTPFLREGEEELRGGYVFPDGSFSSEGELTLRQLRMDIALQRFSTGAIYPYGGAVPLRGYSEEERRNALGQTVELLRWQGGRVELWYLSEDGETFVALKINELPGAAALDRAGFEDEDALLRYLMDAVDFDAICEKNSAAAQILDVPRGAEENADALARLEAFYDSPVFRAAREFQDFFTARFYGSCFTGVHGQEGYEDLSAELERLAEKYGLRYATAKTQEGDTVRYDNGAMTIRETGPADQVFYQTGTHYIPKDALYTRMIHYVSFAEYQRVWTYETAEGQQILCATEGPEKISGSYLVYETESAWVLVQIGHRDPAVMEQAAEAIDWTAFE